MSSQRAALASHAYNSNDESSSSGGAPARREDDDDVDPSEVSAVVATSVSVSLEMSAMAYVVEGVGRWW